MVLDFLAVDSFDFTRKIVKKIWGEKLVKIWGLVKTEFLDKNLTFRIVCTVLNITEKMDKTVTGSVAEIMAPK